MCVSKSFNSTALPHVVKLKMCVCVCMCVKAGSATACGGTAGVGPSWIVRSDRKDTKCIRGEDCSGLSGGSLGHV